MTKAKRALSVRALSVTHSDEGAPAEVSEVDAGLQAEAEAQLRIGDLEGTDQVVEGTDRVVESAAPAAEISTEVSEQITRPVPVAEADGNVLSFAPDDGDTDDLATASQSAEEAAAPTEMAEMVTDALADAPAAGDVTADEITASAETAESGDAGAITPIGEAPIERLSEILESLLFAAEGLLTVKQLQEVTGEPSPSRVTQALEALRKIYETRGVELAVVGGAYGFRTTPRNAVWVQKMLGRKPVRLTRAQLEALSIIAYRQPVTRPELEEIRGVDSGAPLKILLERNLVRVLGKREEAGRPLLYGTSKEFLEFFQLKDLSELPSLREVYELSDVAAAEATAEESAPLVAVDLPAFDGTHGESLLQELEAAEAALARATDGVSLDANAGAPAQGGNPTGGPA